MADKDREEEKAASAHEDDHKHDAEPKHEAVPDDAEPKQHAADEDQDDEAPKKAAPADSDEEGEHEASGASKEEDEDEDRDERPAPKKSSKSGEAARRRGRRPPPKGGSLGKSIFLFAMIIVPVAIVAVLLGREDQSGGQGPVPAPKWSDGQVVDVEITVVPSDKSDLACASADKIKNRHCQFETAGKPFVDPSNDDKLLLKPYTTTDHVQFAAAGLWSDPALAPGKIPAIRFSVKCKYTVEGKLKPNVRWNSDGPWYPQQQDWYAGSLSACTLVPAT